VCIYAFVHSRKDPHIFCVLIFQCGFNYHDIMKHALSCIWGNIVYQFVNKIVRNSVCRNILKSRYISV